MTTNQLINHSISVQKQNYKSEFYGPFLFVLFAIITAVIGEAIPPVLFFFAGYSASYAGFILFTSISEEITSSRLDFSFQTSGPLRAILALVKIFMAVMQPVICMMLIIIPLFATYVALTNGFAAYQVPHLTSYIEPAIAVLLTIHALFWIWLVARHKITEYLQATYPSEKEGPPPTDASDFFSKLRLYAHPVVFTGTAAYYWYAVWTDTFFLIA